MVLGLKYLVGILQIHDSWNTRHEATGKRICFRTIREILTLLVNGCGLVRYFTALNERLNVGRRLSIRLPDSLKIRLPIGQARERWPPCLRCHKRQT
jgi:hypothetical protein